MTRQRRTFRLWLAKERPLAGRRTTHAGHQKWEPFQDATHGLFVAPEAEMNELR
jgi:hypothetical protein